jgi:hypothetical protein
MLEILALVMTVCAARRSFETRREYVRVGSTLTPASDGLKRASGRAYLSVSRLRNRFEIPVSGATKLKASGFGVFFGNVAGRSQRRDYIDVFTSFPKKDSESARTDDTAKNLQ